MSSITTAFLFVVKNIERLCWETAKAGNGAERKNGSGQRRCMFLGGGGEHKCKTRRINREVLLFICSFIALLIVNLNYAVWPFMGTLCLCICCGRNNTNMENCHCFNYLVVTFHFLLIKGQRMHCLFLIDTIFICSVLGNSCIFPRCVRWRVCTKGIYLFETSFRISYDLKGNRS